LHFNELAASTYMLYEFCCDNKDWPVAIL
jgi:hypothetical protein